MKWLAFPTALRSGRRLTARSPAKTPSPTSSPPAAHPSAATPAMAGPTVKLANPFPGSGIPNVRVAAARKKMSPAPSQGNGRMNW